MEVKRRTERQSERDAHLLGIQPAFGVILSKVIAVSRTLTETFHFSSLLKVFQECDPKVQEKRLLSFILLFIVLGFSMLITMFLQVSFSPYSSGFVSTKSWLQSFLFALSGEALTQRLRARIFRLLLRQEVAFFDRPENNTGALCTRLATEASDVQGVNLSIGFDLFWSLQRCV